MEQLAPHEKVFVADTFVRDPYHGVMGCQECHGGDPGNPDYLTAHDGVVRDPSHPPGGSVCADCHPEIADSSRTSLHTTLAPFARLVRTRASTSPDIRASVDRARATHCSACHISCGQCHVSRPTYVGGGLMDGHVFQRKPPMRETCTACHSSRIAQEYFGHNGGTLPDVHWRERFFDCMRCHDGKEMHGDGLEPKDRYHVANAPRCEHCHLDIYGEDAPNGTQHRTHRDLVSCHVCHSQPYASCYDCHLALDDFGFRYYRSSVTVLNFKIGRNAQPTPLRPETYVLLRHVPVTSKTFAYYAKDGLSRFAALPTWKPATPHNIQRRTPQNASCNACHGNTVRFLLPGDVCPGECVANRDVVVPETMVPARVDFQAAQTGHDRGIRP